MTDSITHVTWLARQCADRGLKLAHGRALLDALWAADILGQHGGHVARAAEAAGMDRGQFYRLLGRSKVERQEDAENG
jgi:2-hydroxychromene-2-carboxylate isomerase